MKKALFISLVLSLFFTSCSSSQLDDELEEIVNEPNVEYNEPTKEDSEPTEEENVLMEEYNEPLIFLNKNKTTIWERTGKYDDEHKFYARILSESNKYAEIWSLNITDKDCYFKYFYYGNSIFSIVEDTENNLIIEGSVGHSSPLRRYEMSIRNDTLIESRDFYSSSSAIIEINTWVRSEVNVDSLKLCEYSSDDSAPPPPF